VRIPLDYYRILGLPVQATPQQLEQAYRDRTLQLPRREYSASAIQSRKQLLEEAYQILSNPEKRDEYDRKFFRQTYDSGSPISDEEISVSLDRQDSPKDVEGYIPYVESLPEQFVGGLLVLQELGEYELVLQLAEPYLVKVNVENDAIPNRADLVLVISLSYLELARELWHQREYEEAATQGKMGLELLYQEELFLGVQGEIQNELYKLRPYRILELVSQPLEKAAERTKGIRLLQEMLSDRHGIDGKGNDHSGLNIDDFLQFIQQLRVSLTAEEQQELFELEAQRPSAVAGYLAVYALIARGFSEKRPAFIVRAEEILFNLGQRQDVHLELAICVLLLGMTDEVNQILEQSQDDKAFRFIKEKSKGSVDLLPGLCVYTEAWLTGEVFPQFRDLIGQKALLEEYFSDRLVQRYIEKLSSKNETDSSLSVEEKLQVPHDASQDIYATDYPELKGRSLDLINPEVSPYPSFRGNTESESTYAPPSLDSYNANENDFLTKSKDKSNQHSKERQRSPKSRKKGHKPKLSRATKRLFVFLVLGLLGIGVLALASRVFQGGEELEIYVNKPLVEMPTRETKSPEELLQSSQKLDKALAETIIKVWLNSKAKSFGKEHQTDALGEILAPSLLRRWRSRAEELKNSNSYYEYLHNVKIISVKVNPQKPQSGTIEAEVKEYAKFYQNERQNNRRSYDDELLINYGVARVNDRWLITEINLVQ
jgi:curved DNA-binding protein CbpA